MSVSKPRQIKPWPDLTGLLPLLRADDGLTKTRTGKIHLDMSNVNKVDAIGLSIFIAQTCQIFFGKEFQLVITDPKNKRVAIELEELRFQYILYELNILPNEPIDLFSTSFNSSDKKGKTGEIKGDFNKIICISAESMVDRSAEIVRVKGEIKEFLKNDKVESFPHQQLMIILVELVKNTLDHSGNSALLALKLECSSQGVSRFSFAYSDTGIGICHSVRRHMAAMVDRHILEKDEGEIKVIEYKRLAAKGSFADFLQWALKPGNSTKYGNGINLGLGLMLIAEASKNCNVRLTVKDADTSMVLTELSDPTHSLIRKLGVKTCAAPMLIFYGEIDLEMSYGN